MDKYKSLFNKMVAFQKLAEVGLKDDFLKSLAQEVTSVGDKLNPAVNKLYSDIRYWVKNNGVKDPSIPGTDLVLPVSLRSPVQVLVSAIRNNTYDIDELNQLKLALKQLMIANNLTGVSSDGSDKWIQEIFPQASYVADLVNSQINFINSYRRKNVEDFEEPATSQTVPAKQTVPTKQTVPVKTPQDPRAVIHATVKSVIDKTNKLTDDNNRVNQLKDLENNVKFLQNSFKKIQNNNDLKSYFAKIDIIKALNTVYNVLDDKDLQTVVSLGPGKSGIPASPDAKIS